MLRILAIAVLLAAASPCWADKPNPQEGRRWRESEAWSFRSEEHTSELQSPDHLACRPLLEKKNPAQRGAARRTRTHLGRTPGHSGLGDHSRPADDTEPSLRRALGEPEPHHRMHCSPLPHAL